jgi:hypothetical protein
MRRLVRSSLAGLVVAQALAAGGAEAPPLRLWVTPALRDCAAALAAGFSSRTGVAVAVRSSDVPEPAEADLLIGADSELTRVLEGGLGDERSAVRLGEVPWVMLLPDGEAPPRDLASFAATGSSPIAVLGGIAGREARAALASAAGRVAVSRDAAELASQERALVPRTLAGHRTQAPVEDVTPLSILAVPVVASPRGAEVRALLQFLAGAEAKRTFAACGGAPPPARALQESVGGYAQSVVDWWVPACSLAHNSYNYPAEVVGAPNAQNLGGKDLYSGMMSLGQGGWVIVDMGFEIHNRPGADVRVYQTTSSEPVTLYASEFPTGPFTLVGLMKTCGTPSAVFSNHCDFDFANNGIAQARYLRVEDGEVYPCLAGTTLTEGADIDAVASVNR